MEREGYRPVEDMARKNFEAGKQILREQAGRILTILTPGEQSVLEIELSQKGLGLDFIRTFERPEDLAPLINEWQAAYRSGDEGKRIEVRTKIVEKLLED